MAVSINKTVGPDDIHMELWRCSGESVVDYFTRLFNTVLETEMMPIMIKFYKKENKHDLGVLLLRDTLLILREI